MRYGLRRGLATHLPLNADSRAAFERLRQRAIIDGPIPIVPEGPIFLGTGGQRLLGPRHWFEGTVKKAGLANFTWHDLRHTFASRSTMADVDVRAIADLLGHKNIQMTMKYSHLAPGTQVCCRGAAGRI